MSIKDKFIFWGAVSGLSAVLFGSCYYLYKYMKDIEEEDDDNEYANINESELFENGKLTEKGAVITLMKINKIATNKYQKDYPEIDEKRRKAINSEIEYSKICAESLEFFSNCYQTAAKEFFDNLTIKITFEQFQEFLQNIPPQKLDELNMEYFELSEEDKKFGGEKAKEAYIYYANTFLNEMTEFQNKYANFDPNNQMENGMQELIMIEMISRKLRADDMLFLKYKIKEDALKAILYQNHLLLDPEIKELNDKLKQFDHGMK